MRVQWIAADNSRTFRVPDVLPANDNRLNGSSFNTKHGQTTGAGHLIVGQLLKTGVVSMGRRNSQLRPTFIENKS